MSGEDNKTTTTSSSEPADWAKEGYEWAGDAATAAAQAGTLAQPNTMSTVVPYSTQTTSAMNTQEGLANYAQDRANQNYINVYDNLNNGGLNDLQDQSVSALQSLVNSSYSTSANPGFEDVLQQSIDEATNAVNQNAAAMGRYNSGAHQGVLAQEVGDLTSRMINDDYNRYLERYDSAVSELFNAGQQQQDNINAGSENLAAAYETMMQPQQTLMDVGSMYEDLYARQLNDQLRIADETANQERDNLRELMALLGGSGQFSETTQTAQGASSDLSNILGGLLGIGSLLSL